jgi:hypothetical protein
MMFKEAADGILSHSLLKQQAKLTVTTERVFSTAYTADQTQ